MNNPSTYRGSHIISDPSCNIVVETVEQFKKDKVNFQVIYNTTPVIAGMLPSGQANMIVIASALCLWDTTLEEYKSWRKRFELSGNKIIM